MRSTDPSRDASRTPTSTRARAKGWLARLSALMLAAGCSSPTPPPPAPRPAPASPPGTAVRPAPAPPSALKPAPRRARDWDDYRFLAAQRIAAASPGGSFEGPVPEPLLAIPVLEVELNGDGSVRRINVMRRPRQALDTVQLAIDAVHRAAPFGDVTHLPRPWKFTEVFLFADDRRFKPRSLDV